MAMTDRIKIGTRESELATWQAKSVAGLLKKNHLESEIVFVKSEGDLDLTTPLTEMGGKGVFTKALDEALINGTIDVAVHSYKDLPTEISLPLKVSAVLEREDPRDALVAPAGLDFLEDESFEAIIATGSNRRKAQWLHKYPNHNITNIRGNVNTRLKKVDENAWQGAIFAAAGLKRINLEHHIASYLDWMVPAPAQGAIAVMVREDDPDTDRAVRPLNHRQTDLCTRIERDLLNEMEAGCSAPVGAYATMKDDIIYFYAVALAIDGSLQYDIELSAPVRDSAGLGRTAARDLLAKGAGRLVEDLRK